MTGRIWHRIVIVAFAALMALSCRREDAYMRADAQLMVSLYIPGATMTRAETGMVNPLSEELKFTSLRIWAFFSDTGELISYKCFQNSEDTPLNQTGLPNSTITRFGLPLSGEKFNLLTASPRRPVDVYAVANIESAVSAVPGKTASREDLDGIIVSNIGGSEPLTRSVPDAGLPMSGVLKGASVTGGYPVLNISTLKLTRAVSKIRFVFCQQGIPATETEPAVIANTACEILGISFDGISDGKDCQIATTERLFTENTIDLGDEPGYVPLSASVSGTGGNPIIPNSNLSVVEDPELLFFRSAGNEGETAEHYESRLDAAVSPESQVGPVYLRETDKRISGEIRYRTSSGGDVQTASFSMDARDVFSRNHTWIVYACFVEETMKLRLKVVVMPWDWDSYVLDYTTSSINVIRRFTVFDAPVPRFYKKEIRDSFYEIRFWHTVRIDDLEEENSVTGEIIIATPVGGTLHVIPVPQPGTLTPNVILVSPSTVPIYPNYVNMANGRIEDCQIRVTVRCNTELYTPEQLEQLAGQYIDLYFSVETPDHRFVDLGSESIDFYRFILDPDWKSYLE